MGTFATKKILPGNPSLIPAIAEQIRTEFMAEQFEVHKTTRHVAEYGRGRGLKSTFNILNSSIAVPRSITGCGVSNRGGVTK